MLLCEIYGLVVRKIPQNAQYNHNLIVELPRKAQEMSAVLTQHVGTISMWNVDWFFLVFLDKFLDLFNQFQPSNWTTSKPEDMDEVNFYHVPYIYFTDSTRTFLSVIINITIYNCCGL